MNNKINGFTSNATLLGVESRSSAPIRFYRDENMESNIKGIYQLAKVLDMLEVLCQVQLMV